MKLKEQWHCGSRWTRPHHRITFFAFFGVVFVALFGLRGVGVASEATSLSSQPEDRFCEKNRNWMKSLPDSRRLSDLALPGTHDTCATRNGVSFGFAKCQSWKLEDQLRAGVRFLDIRCKHIENEFHIYHGVIDQKTKFKEVVATCQKFLKQQPGECIVMSVMEEGAGRDTGRSFLDTFRDEIQSSESMWVYTSAVPRLGEVRGKVVLVDRVGSLKGFPWSQLEKQDDYQAKIDKKKSLIREWYTRAVKDAGQRWFINYCSGTLPRELVTPKKYAAETNEVALELLRASKSETPARGIFVYDFPSEVLIQTTIDANPRSKEEPKGENRPK